LEADNPWSRISLSSARLFCLCRCPLVFNHAEETIGIENSPVDFLAASQKLDDNGFASALCVAPKLVSPIALNLEVEYSFMLRKPVNDSGRRVPNLGGLYYSAGLSFYFNN